MATHGSPTTAGSGMDFPPAYHSQHHPSVPPPAAPQSPLKSRAPQQFGAGVSEQGTYTQGRYESPSFARGSPAAFGHSSDNSSAPQVTSPTGLRSRQHQQYQQPQHHAQQPPPPYGSAPPPPYEGVMGHASPMMPPPPSYQEHIASHHQSRHETPLHQRDQSPRGSPSREHPLGTPTTTDPPARFRHDPYSPEGSRMVSPNRRMSTSDRDMTM